MRLRSAFVVAAASMAACCALSAGPASASTRPPAADPAGTWSTAQTLPGPGGGASGSAYTVSCSAPGDCSAGGEYSDDGGQAFVANETNGTWGSEVEVPGTATLNTGGLALVDTVSCTSPGNCAAGGTYSVGNPNDEQAFVVNETDGTWGNAEEVPGTAALNVSDAAEVFTVSCASAGNCAAGGTYWDGSGNFQAFLVNETGGVWGTAEEVPGTAALNLGNASVKSVSCSGAGDCTAVGNYTDSSDQTQAFTVDETDGTWGDAQEVPGMATLSDDGYAYVTWVSCPSPGNCGAIGEYWNGSTNYDEAFVVNETDGTWGDAQEVPGMAAASDDGTSWADASSCDYAGDCAQISCPTAGNCTITGELAVGGSSADVQGFVDSETDGTWGNAAEIPGLAALNSNGYIDDNSVSCGSAGNCAVVGDYHAGTESGYEQAFVADETDGTWGTAEEIPGTAALNTGQIATAYSVSCASATSCAAVGAYSSSGGGGGFVSDLSAGTPTSTALTLSAPTVTYGDEQSEQVSVTVSAGSAGTPSGTVEVTSSSATVCTITLTSGTGSCALTATQLAGGTAQLTATYAGSATYATSASAAESLTVATASTTTGLTLSTSTATYGDEESEELTVTVTPQYAGSPSGTVVLAAIRTSTPNEQLTFLPTITLVNGKGTYTFTASQLPAGSYALVATYGGNTDYAKSASAENALVIAQ